VRAVDTPIYLTHADLRARYACSPMWVRRQIQNNHFPKPVKFGAGVGVRCRWLAADLQAWEEEWLPKPLDGGGVS
jgi:predicted DNA-binding transcriptional regulator AlpA